MASDTTLIPCPWPHEITEECHKPEAAYEEGGERVWCPMCGVMSPPFATRQKACAWWNRRAAPAGLTLAAALAEVGRVAVDGGYLVGASDDYRAGWAGCAKLLWERFGEGHEAGQPALVVDGEARDLLARALDALDDDASTIHRAGASPLPIAKDIRAYLAGHPAAEGQAIGPDTALPLIPGSPTPREVDQVADALKRYGRVINIGRAQLRYTGRGWQARVGKRELRGTDGTLWSAYRAARAAAEGQGEET